jgi:hypothetical protein
MSTIDNRYNQYKNGTEFDENIKTYETKTFATIKPLHSMRTKNRTTIPCVTLTINKRPPYPKRQHTDVHMTAPNFMEQKNILKC